MTLEGSALLALFASAVSLTAAGCGLAPSAPMYIVGGHEASTLEFPWQVSLNERQAGWWSHTCGGSIIDKDWVLTAAHCVNELSQQAELKVIFGAHDLETPHENIRSSQILNAEQHVFIHDQYNDTYLDYDFALIKLQSSLDFSREHSHLAAICLPSVDDLDGFINSTCVTSGWGTTVVWGNTVVQSMPLQKLDMEVVAHDSCARTWTVGCGSTRRSLVTESHICATAPLRSASGICDGDSGGPLQCLGNDGRWQLAGATSFAKGCGVVSYPDVFARVSKALPWIERLTGGVLSEKANGALETE